MSQNALQIPTASPLPGLTMVQDANNALSSLATVLSGASAPTSGGLGLSGLAGINWHDLTNALMKIRDQADSAWIPWLTLNESTKYAIAAGVHGKCKLAKSGSNLALTPKDGNTIIINKAVQFVPSAGITLTTGGLSSSTLYYIYAFMSGATMTLEASATAYAIDTTSGVSIKSGDGTRTLVGMGYTDGATAWQDNATQRFVRSYFNEYGIQGNAGMSVNRTTTSATWAEINSETKTEFLLWNGEALTCQAFGTASVNGTPAIGYGVGIDQTTGTPGIAYTTPTSGGSGIGMNVSVGGTTLQTEGYHYVTILGQTASNTLTASQGNAVSYSSVRRTT